MKILHLINDHQVIERTMGVYENLFPHQNDVLIFNKTDKYKHLDKYASCTLVTPQNLKKIATRYDFSDVTHVIAHYMTMDKIDFIKFVPQKIHVCWEVYGFDLYNQFLEPNGYKMFYSNPSNYHPHSFVASHLRVFVKLFLLAKGFRYSFLWQKNKQFNYICNRINSIQYCCKYDALYIEDYAHRQIPSYEVFNYSLSEVLGELKDAPFSSGKNIMVGNSASFSNNHLYVLKYLRNIGIDDGFIIIMPISYGGRRKYIEEIETCYKKEFYGRIKFIKNYMPLSDYNKIFLNLNSCIMSAWRQESIGTIIMCLYMGVKVFMSNRSPLYKWLKECGFVIYEIETATNKSVCSSLDATSQQYNRNLVNMRYNDTTVADNLKSNII